MKNMTATEGSTLTLQTSNAEPPAELLAYLSSRPFLRLSDFTAHDVPESSLSRSRELPPDVQQQLDEFALSESMKPGEAKKTGAFRPDFHRLVRLLREKVAAFEQT